MVEEAINKDNNYIIKVENLYKTYGNITAINKISFNVNKGEVFGMLGPNGAGKTTTIEILETLRDYNSGIAHINGLEVNSNQKEIKSKIGIQLQSNSFFDYLTLGETINLYSKIYKTHRTPQEMLSKVELNDKSKAYYKELSGGQKQRFSKAIALINNPIIIFIDEPTTGLDPQARRNLWDLIKDIKKQGITIMLTTHYMEEAQELCDRVAIINNGNIVALDSPNNLIQELLDNGFTSQRIAQKANLEDVFINLTGNELTQR